MRTLIIPVEKHKGIVHPIIYGMYNTVLQVTASDSDSVLGNIVSICRRNSSNPFLFATPLLAEKSASLLSDEIDDLVLEIQKIESDAKEVGMSDRRKQYLAKLVKRLNALEAAKAKTLDGGVMLQAGLEVRVKSKNVPGLERRASHIKKALKLRHIQTIEPPNRIERLREILSFSPPEGQMFLLDEDLAQILRHFVTPAMSYTSPEGALFGKTDWGDLVFEDITKHQTKGIGFVSGSTGAGKTYFFATLGEFLKNVGYKVVIFDPKGAYSSDEGAVSFPNLLEYCEGFFFECNQINIFDMFENEEKQDAYERAAIGILCKNPDGYLIDILCQKADDIRLEGRTPTFSAIKSLLEEEIMHETVETMVPSLSSELMLRKRNIERAIKMISTFAVNTFEHTPEPLKRLERDMIVLDFSSIGDDFRKKAIMNLAMLRLKQTMRDEPRFILIDELHEVLEHNPSLGTPSMLELVKILVTEGRQFGNIAVGAAQSDLLLRGSETGKMFTINRSWSLYLGKHDIATQEALGVPPEYHAYLAELRKNDPASVGNGLLVVEGKPPIKVHVDIPGYLHEVLTGQVKQAERLKTGDEFEPVIRLPVKDEKIIKRQGYRKTTHKELSGKTQQYLVKGGVGPQEIDLFNASKHFVKADLDYDQGCLYAGDCCIYVQSYEPEDVLGLIEALDKAYSDWYVLYHEGPPQEVIGTNLEERFVPLTEARRLSELLKPSA